MLQILKSTLELVWGLLSGVLSILSTLLTWVGDVLYHLHVDAPRLEGLLIGIALAWLMSRRDRHPILRVLSSPLKLVVDVLDLAWDQVVEIAVDVKEVVQGWASGSASYAFGKVKSAYDKVLDLLRGLRDKLSK